MEDKEKGSAAEPTPSGNEPEKKDSVAYDSYRKAVAEAKRAKAEAEELRQKLSALDADKLETEGKKDELIQRLKSERTEWEKQAKEKDRLYATRVITSQIKAVAAELGAVDPDAVVALGQWDEIEVKDNFEIDPHGVKQAVESLSKAKPYLFKKSGPQFRDATPKDKPTILEPKKLNEMSTSDLKALYAKIRTTKAN